MEKVIVIPEWRYEKMVESYDKAMSEIQELQEQLQIFKESGSHEREDQSFL